MSSGVSAPSTRTPALRQRDFLVRLAQRRLLERLAGLDDAARQRHLSAVAAERVGAHGQHDVRASREREQQQQAGGVADRAGEAGRPARGAAAARAGPARRQPGRGLASAEDRSAIRAEKERGNWQTLNGNRKR